MKQNQSFSSRSYLQKQNSEATHVIVIELEWLYVVIEHAH